jgi:hypothetical protein
MRRVFFLAALMLSCIRTAEQPPGYPLYSNSGARLPHDRVAELVASMPGGTSVGAGSAAFIKKVDGKDVSTIDTAFELLPGCHIVQTESKLLISNAVLTWHGELGPRIFAFQMKPGNTYVVKLELVESMGSSGRIFVYGLEQNAAGDVVQRIEPTKSGDDVRTCMEPTAALAPAVP